MAVLKRGILGGISGKVANVVGGRWKTTDYIRSLVTPANPRSAAQVIQRDKMSLVVHLARQVLGSVINAYWDPFVTSISGFNAFVQKNIKLVEDPIDYLAFFYTVGKLTIVEITSAVYTTGTGVIVCSWDTALIGNMKADDKPLVLCYDEGTDKTTIGGGSEVRSDGARNVTIETGRDVAELSVFLFFTQAKDGILDIVSDSVSILAEVP